MSDTSAIAGARIGFYPERKELRSGALDKVAANLGGMFVSRFRPGWQRFEGIIEAVHAEGAGMEGWSQEKIHDAAQALRPFLGREGYKMEWVARAFALVREAARRTLKMPHFDVQLVGGMVLLKGMVAEMETGEGKTLVATLPACTAALAGIPVHIITVNDYLAQRDAEWMGPIYRAFGLSVGTIVHGMDPGAKRFAYQCDVTYCTNKEAAFDYLRDRIVLWDRPSQVRLQLERLYGDASRLNQLLLRGLHYAIIDEADSVLIDESRTPLIISSEAEGLYEPRVYQQAIDFAMELKRQNDYIVSSSEHMVDLTHKGKMRAKAFDWNALNFHANEDQRQELVRQALVALYLFNRDKHYLIKDGKIQIIDEFTGRLMADRSWEHGLHQLIEVKEGCEVTQRKDTKARISYQRFFRRYLKLAGMTGSAREVAGELWTTYKMPVVTIPTNKPMKRRYFSGRVLRTSKEKWEAVVQNVSQMHQKDRPVLVGTRSVESSESLSGLLESADLPHRVLNARQDKEEAEIISMAGQRRRITVATNMAGRGTDILLGPGVTALGGLHVIATELNESGRIDRQLFGRCARQGDPGTCQAIVSLEDELITAHTGKLLRWLAALSLRVPEGLLSRWLSKILFRKAQWAAERLHRRMRRDLLKMDEQISDSLAFTGQLE
jgi:preprotein translocase subunit SecA